VVVVRVGAEQQRLRSVEREREQREKSRIGVKQPVGAVGDHADVAVTVDQDEGITVLQGAARPRRRRRGGDRIRLLRNRFDARMSRLLHGGLDGAETSGRSRASTHVLQSTIAGPGCNQRGSRRSCSIGATAVFQHSTEFHGRRVARLMSTLLRWLIAAIKVLVQSLIVTWTTLAIYYSNLPWPALRLGLAVAFA